MTQETFKNKAEAEKEALNGPNEKTYLGARILSTGRGRQLKYFVQRFFSDPGGAPPMGMARLSMPDGLDALVAELAAA